MRRRLHRGVVRTDEFARGLLSRPAEYIRMVGVGRLWIVWDTNVRATAPTPDLAPRSNDPSRDAVDAARYRERMGDLESADDEALAHHPGSNDPSPKGGS